MSKKSSTARSDGSSVCTVDIRQCISSPGIAEKLFAGGKVDALQQVEQHLQVQNNRIDNFRQVNNEKVGA
jgi:hypothetical protein